MSTKREPKTQEGTAVKRGNSSNTWRGFVNLEMTEKSKEQAINLTADNLKFWAEIEGSVMSGYRLSVTYSQSTGVFNATITGTVDHPTDEGLAVTARSKRIDVAIAAVLTKLSVHGAFDLNRHFGGNNQIWVDV